jgi:aldose 1-epimerase
MKRIFFLIAAVVFFSCSKTPEQPVLIDEASFAGSADGKSVELFTLKNNNGLVTQITNYGGRVVTLWVPGKDGNFADIVTGYDTFDGLFELK